MDDAHTFTDATIEIVEIETGTVVESFPCAPSNVERIISVVLINLDRDRFAVREA